MPITNPEWESISQMIDAIVRRVVGTRADFFTTGKVVKVDPTNKCVYLAEFGDQPIPITGFDRTVTYYYEVSDVDIKHVVGAAGEPAFQNSWVNYDVPTWGSANFSKDSSGIVHLEGLVMNGTLGAAIFTLPAGYRPAKQLLFAVLGNNILGRLDVTPTGAVQFSVGSNAYVQLSGITFDSGVPMPTKVIRKSVTAGVVMPKVGESVLVAREMGTRRLPRAIGVIQGKNWIVAEEE